MNGGTLDSPPTGDRRADAVLASLEDLSARPLQEHVTGFERAHEELQALLDATDPG